MFKSVGLTGKPRELQDSSWSEARTKMYKVFGIEVVELFNNKDKADKKVSLGFVLINRLPENPGGSHLEFDEEENARTGLLFAVLALIFMSEDVVKEEVLFKFLG